MAHWPRSEIESAFIEYQQRAATAGASADWRAWADLFTEDATYIEHHYGTVTGREAIYNLDQFLHVRVSGARHAGVPYRVVHHR
jgi:hypothetical protein